MDTMKITIIDARQSRRPSMWRGVAITLAMPTVFFGPGILTGSGAMQWAGFVLFMCLAGLTAIVIAENRKRLTISEARQKLDELEAEN